MQFSFVEHIDNVSGCVQEHKLKVDDTFKSHHEAIDKLHHEIFLLQVPSSFFDVLPLSLLPYNVLFLFVVFAFQCTLE